jgi:predicted regulator of Ras-like GTPase activity (Roadblock/LC7/MglB family)
MVLDKLGELFDDKGLGRLKDMADAFGDNKDRIFEAVDWVWDHRDEMAEVVQKLPELLGGVGESLAAAGDGAVRAGSFLTSVDGDSVAELTGTASDALERSLDEIEAASKIMGQVGGQVDAVGMFDGVADSLSDGAGRLLAIGGDLAEVAVQMRSMGDQITDAGDDLVTVGGGLQAGGVALAGFGGKEVKTLNAKKPAKRPKSTSKKLDLGKPT